MDGMGDDRRNSGGLTINFLNVTFIKPIFIASVEEQILSAKEGYAQFTGNYAPDNVDLARQPINIG